MKLPVKCISYYRVDADIDCNNSLCPFQLTFFPGLQLIGTVTLQLERRRASEDDLLPVRMHTSAPASVAVRLCTRMSTRLNLSHIV